MNGPARRALARLAALALTLTMAPGVWAQGCGPLPGAYAFYAGGKISLDKDTTVNGHGVEGGSTEGDTAIAPDGSRVSGVPLDLPALDPAVFPANDSTLKADAEDSPFSAGTAVFYAEVKVAKDRTVTFSGGGPFHIGKLDAAKDVTLRLGAGTYYLGVLQADQDFRLEVTSGPVVIHVGEKLQVAMDASLNPTGTVADLRLYLHEDAVFQADKDLEFTGVVYGPDAAKVQIDKDADIRGTMAVGGEVDLKKDTAITYSPADQAAVADITTCEDSASGLHHLRLVHDGAALTCLPEAVTVLACADADCATPFPGEVQVTLSPGGWVGGDTHTVAAGAATLQLRHTTPETVVLGIPTASPLPDNPTRCIGAGVDGACGLPFAAAGFAVALPPGVACAPVTATIRAVRTGDDGVSCAPAFTGPRPVELWTGHLNPATGTRTLVVDGVTTGTTAPGVSATLDFDASGRAALEVRYDDAGQVQLNARYQGSGEEAGLLLGGAGTTVFRPLALALYSPDPAASCPAADATCTPFAAAGAPFELRARAVCGPADGDLTDNPVTPNFTLAGIPLSHQVVAPAGGSTGSLGVATFAIAAGDGGEHVIPAQTLSEVGVFTVSTPVLDYLGTTVPAATSPPLGRFVPAHLELHSPQAGTLANGCPGFTYSGQQAGGVGAVTHLTPPQVDLTARNGAGATTRNYTGAFAPLAPTHVTVSPPAADAAQVGTSDTPVGVAATLAPGTLTDLGQLAPGDPDHAPGTHRYRMSLADHFRYLRDANARIAPFTARLRFPIAGVVDGDGVTATGLPMDLESDGAQVRFGRVALTPAHGSDLSDLVLPVTIEHFDGVRFVANPDEDGLCTAPTATDLTLAKVPPSLPDPTLDAIASGRGAVVFPCAAGGCTTGYVDVTLDLAGYPWLRYDWDNDDGLGDGPFDDDPGARASFGIYRGSPAVIYQREP